MEISMPISNVNTQYIYFADKKKNIIVNGSFIKIIYSTESFEMNGLYIFAEFEPNQTDHLHNWKDTGDDWIQIVGKTPAQKHVLHFNPCLNSNNIDRLCQIEFDILNRYVEMNPTHKQPVYILKNQLLSGVIKYYSENNNTGEKSAAKNPVILKIAGLWETDTNVGITMKFILPNIH